MEHASGALSPKLTMYPTLFLERIAQRLPLLLRRLGALHAHLTVPVLSTAWLRLR
jgi:hypothetical protein